jgi:hypothetical protein
MIRTTRRPAVLAALLLCMGVGVATVASSPAMASKRCTSVQLDGGRLSALVVTGTGCNTARDVQVSFNGCIVKSLGRGLTRCNHKVLGYTCSDKRVQSAHNATGRVSCHRARKIVRYSYDLPFGPS